MKAADIATDAVGAAEIQGVTKLLFAKCDLTDGESSTNIAPGNGIDISCSIAGVTSSDQATATFNEGFSCFAIAGVKLVSGSANVSIQNVCNSTINPGDNSFISLIIYRK